MPHSCSQLKARLAGRSVKSVQAASTCVSHVPAPARYLRESAARVCQFFLPLTGRRRVALRDAVCTRVAAGERPQIAELAPGLVHCSRDSDSVTQSRTALAGW